MGIIMIFSVFANLNNRETEATAREMLSVLKETDCSVYFDEKYKAPSAVFQIRQSLWKSVILPLLSAETEPQ